MISLIIPTLHAHNGLQRCIDSFKDQVDEVIVIDDTDISLAAKQNKGMRMAKGDYLIISNDDVEACEGSLEELCIPDKVISPQIHGGTLKTFHGHMFCLPRTIYAEVGGFDETCPGPYHIDSDLWLRFIDAGYSPELSNKVTIFHNHPASTLSKIGASQYDTRQWFINKWGDKTSKIGA